MKCIFSEEALTTMKVCVDIQKQQTKFTRKLYKCIDRALYPNIFLQLLPTFTNHKISLSVNELEYLWDVCYTNNHSFLDREKPAVKELAIYLNKPVPSFPPLASVKSSSKPTE